MKKEYEKILQKQEQKIKEEMHILEMKRFIIEAYETNYERMRMETGRALAPATKRQGLQQVLMYFEKLQKIAETVTETEVKLTLPEQISPEGNKFTIEGIVDIIRDGETDKTTMYDIKTHDADFVKEYIDDYKDQLNVYTHIWQELRNERLDETAVIATKFPNTLKKALDKGEDDKLQRELEKWEPIILIPFSQENVKETIHKFACVVDKIENRAFQPPNVSILKGRVKGTRQTFATRFCRNCDARFSCDSFREYAYTSASFAGGFAQYISDLGAADAVEDFTNTNALEAPAPENINDLI